MPDAFIYDHVRTPRGRGKVDGALHEVTALNLASQALGAIKSRNNLDTTLVARPPPISPAPRPWSPGTATPSPAYRSIAFARQGLMP